MTPTPEEVRALLADAKAFNLPIVCALCESWLAREGASVPKVTVPMQPHLMQPHLRGLTYEDCPGCQQDGHGLYHATLCDAAPREQGASVPREPTQEMIAAGVKAWSGATGYGDIHETASRMYAAMYDAAPREPVKALTDEFGLRAMTHLFVDCDGHVYCYRCGCSKHNQPAQCKPDPGTELYKWDDDSFRGAPQPAQEDKP